MKPAMQWIAPFLAVTMLAGQAAAQLLCLPATEAGLCGGKPHPTPWKQASALYSRRLTARKTVDCCTWHKIRNLSSLFSARFFPCISVEYCQPLDGKFQSTRFKSDKFSLTMQPP